MTIDILFSFSLSTMNVATVNDFENTRGLIDSSVAQKQTLNSQITLSYHET